MRSQVVARDLRCLSYSRGAPLFFLDARKPAIDCALRACSVCTAGSTGFPSSAFGSNPASAAERGSEHAWIWLGLIYACRCRNPSPRLDDGPEGCEPWLVLSIALALLGTKSCSPGREHCANRLSLATTWSPCLRRPIVCRWWSAYWTLIRSPIPPASDHDSTGIRSRRAGPVDRRAAGGLSGRGRTRRPAAPSLTEPQRRWLCHLLFVERRLCSPRAA
jgi:hypothetical protein